MYAAPVVRTSEAPAAMTLPAAVVDSEVPKAILPGPENTWVWVHAAARQACTKARLRLLAPTTTDEPS